MQRKLVLASSSPARRELLDRLYLEYVVDTPDIDETRAPHETPADYVRRLSREKAQAVAARHPRALIVGSDQAAVLDGEVIGKPGDHVRAAMQLRAASGRAVEFLTGVCLLDAASGKAQTRLAPFQVHFRTLDEATIERYLHREQPYGCAGSFKSEGLGIALFERLEGDDPTALIGLPLIALVTLLGEAGVAVP
jgi:septum formation protein